MENAEVEGNGCASSPSPTAPPTSTPPTETPETMRDRQWIILAFWIVVAFLGLPHWLWTTSIHRSNLPLESMNQWAEGRACEFRYPLSIRLEAQHLHEGKRKELASIVQQKLFAVPGFQLYAFNVHSGNSSASIERRSQAAALPKDSCDGWAGDDLTISLSPGPASSDQATFKQCHPVIEIANGSPQGQDVTMDANIIVGSIVNSFRNEGQSISYLLSGSPFATGREALLDPEAKTKLDAKTTRAFKYASKYHLTFSLFSATASPSSWDIEAALTRYLSPLLDRLSTISDFTIETQIQLHASFSPSITGPTFNSARNRWELVKSDLSGFVNAAEWPLNPSIGSGPTVNFVLYIPNPEQSPLVIAEAEGTGWLIPQWGGVRILNPSGRKTDRLTVDDLAPAMLAFAEQLTALLGVPQEPPSLAVRISSLTRERATSLILSASSTLGALSRLIQKLTSIAIPHTVSTSVEQTISRLERACADLRAGRFENALHNARVAESEAENAFFEPSMVGQVYFPDEHKVAVYVPLLGPMAVPLIMAALKEIRRLRTGKVKTA